MTKPFWTPEKKADYLKLVKAREHRRAYIRDYMKLARKLGNIKHWRKYKEEKNEN
jgi:hypothetical protein